MRTYAVSIACVLLSWVIIPGARAFDDHDWQFWTTGALEYRIADVWKAKMETEFYFGDDMSDLFYRHADIGIARKMTDWFGIGVNYRFAEAEKNDEWKQEHRPHINGTFYWRLGGLRLSDRNRLEYRIRQDADDLWRYRNRLRIGRPLEWSGLSIEPYASGEVFIDSEEQAVNQNRASAGVDSRLLGHIKIAIYYMLVFVEKNDEWTDANILGTSLSVGF